MTPEEVWDLLTQAGPIGRNFGVGVIRQAINTAVAEEREACATMAEEQGCGCDTERGPDHHDDRLTACPLNLAAAIRVRP